MPKFQSSRLNGVAVITKTHTHILPNLVIPKKNLFVLIENVDIDL